MNQIDINFFKSTLWQVQKLLFKPSPQFFFLVIKNFSVGQFADKEIFHRSFQIIPVDQTDFRTSSLILSL